MSRYFDKDFFKFLIGFVAIIIISLVFLATARELQSGSKLRLDVPQSSVATPQP